MSAYYNEHDAEKAEWIRELIKAGIIAPGEVDERSIFDVSGDDLRGFAQCHFFAGIGVWSYALRLAGWPDDRPVWTGSCPCPSFSAAGKGGGFADPRHLWPEWYRLIRQRRPAVVFGEQVAAAIGYGWLDLVCTDLEAEAYAVAAAVLGAHSVGAPHIRQRLYFAADTADARHHHAGEYGGRQSLLPARLEQCGGVGARHDPGGALGQCADTPHGDRRSGERGAEAGAWTDEERRRRFAGDGATADLCHPEKRGFAMRGQPSGDPGHPAQPSQPGDTSHTGCAGLPHGEPADIPGAGRRDEGRAATEPRQTPGGNTNPKLRRCEGRGSSGPRASTTLPRSESLGPTNGFWAGCDWWYGRDGKWRPIEPGVLPLAHGAPARVLRLRGYGDAICAGTAQMFIESYQEARGLIQ